MHMPEINDSDDLSSIIVQIMGYELCSVSLITRLKGIRESRIS